MSNQLLYDFFYDAEYPYEYKYTATLRRGGKITFVQEGSIFCNSQETAVFVIGAWNKLAQENKGEIEWSYELKGLE